jgi:hypothetical protein
MKIFLLLVAVNVIIGSNMGLTDGAKYMYIMSGIAFIAYLIFNPDKKEEAP